LKEFGLIIHVTAEHGQRDGFRLFVFSIMPFPQQIRPCFGEIRQKDTIHSTQAFGRNSLGAHVSKNRRHRYSWKESTIPLRLNSWR